MVDFAVYLVLFVLLIAASLTDIRSRRIPNKLVLGIVCLWVVWRVLSSSMGANLSITLSQLASSAMATVLIIGISVTFERITGRESMGGGDIKLLSALALFLTWDQMLACMLVASIIGLLYVLLARVGNRGIPYAPCLACGFASLLLLV